MPKTRQIEESDLLKDEVDLLGRLLQGMVRKNLRVSVRLVNRGWAVWREPGGEHIDLTPVGIEQARKLWPDLDENPSVESAAVLLSDSHVPTLSRQLQLDVPPLVGDPRGLLKALAKVIGQDTSGEQLAEAVLHHYPEGRGLATASAPSLRALGIPDETAETIHDAFVLARSCRRRTERWGRGIRVPSDMAEAVYETFGVADLEVEHLWVGAVDSGDSLIDVAEVAKGSLAQVAVSMRDVFTPLCRARAASCFIAHNHPSCDLSFSHDDLKLTQRIVACATRMEIAVLDHIVLAPNGTFASLREEGGFA